MPLAFSVLIFAVVDCLKLINTKTIDTNGIPPFFCYVLIILLSSIFQLYSCILIGHHTFLQYYYHTVHVNSG